MSRPDTAPEDIVVHRDDDGTVTVLNAPWLAAIDDEALLQLDPAWREDDDVIVFPGGYRYLLGAHDDARLWTLLHRLP